MRSYLIQRGRFEESKRGGLDGLVQFDYMGSPEFEFGALPESLRRIKNYIEIYEKTSIILNDKKIIIYCKKDDKEQCKSVIEQHSKREINTKERTDLDRYISGSKFPQRTDFWWDVDNDFMFWKDDEEFTEFIIETLNEG